MYLDLGLEFREAQTTVSFQPKILTVPEFVYDLLNTSSKLCHDSMLFLLTENITVLANI